MKRLALFICTFAYLGYIPFAPGTIGSAAGIAVYLGIYGRFGEAGLFAAIVALFGLGCWSGTVAEAHFRTDDPGQGIVDEVMGMLVTLLFIPVGWRGMVAGFLLFRALDVVKPFPASRMERLPGGLGMMADDFVAAVYANLALRALIWLAPALR